MGELHLGKSELPTPAEMLAEMRAQSDIAGSPAVDDIDAMLKRHGLDIVVWKFENRTSSFCARSKEGGGSETCPVLQLNFRRQADFDAEDIDPHKNNWDDAWVRTDVLRTELNAILTKHGFGDGVVSPRTFIFPHSWENKAFGLLGRRAKPQVKDMVSRFVPAAKGGWFSKPEPEPKHVYWDSSKTYSVVFAKEEAFVRAQPFHGQMEAAAAEIIAQADVDGYCSTTRVKIDLMYMDMKGISLGDLVRED